MKWPLSLTLIRTCFYSIFVSIQLQQLGCMSIGHRQRLIHLTLHIFRCHMPDSWISS
jgi:hypothetical protein